MKHELPLIDIEMEIRFEERSSLDPLLCAIERDDIDTAIMRMESLGDPRTLRHAAMIIGSYASENTMPCIMLDMVTHVGDPKMRFGWLLECLELGFETDLEGESVFCRAEKEIFEIDDSDFAISAMLALERHGQLAFEKEPLSDHFDPDIANLTLVPDFALA